MERGNDGKETGPNLPSQTIRLHFGPFFHGIQLPPQPPFAKVRSILSWLVCLSVAASMFAHAWGFFQPDRHDGNSGHTTIDFASQWLMGRMILDGEGHRLYDLPTIRRVLECNYPRADEDPQQPRAMLTR